MTIDQAKKKLRQTVYEALFNAEVNSGLNDDDPMMIAYDMVRCYSEVEEYEPEEILPYIVEWRESRKAMQQG